MARIKSIHGREILDSRGNPTVEVEMVLDNGVTSTASVPSGASTGSREALELRDNDNTRYHGKGVLKAVSNVNGIIAPALVGMELDQLVIDKKMIELDGTNNKSRLGANATLAVSIATLRAASNALKKSIYEYVSPGKVTLPIPMMNILNGGVHASNNLDIQEFMIVPVVKTFREKVRCGSEIFHTLKSILKENGKSTSVGDEGGFAPELESNTKALDYIVEAITKSGYIPGKDVYIAIDAAASEMYVPELNQYKLDGQMVSADKLMSFYAFITSKYPVISIEDPFEENDFESLAIFTKLLGSKIMVVGDDYFVTNKIYLEKGIKNKAGNAILLKANQIGTISEMVDTMSLAKKNNYKMIISHRSGETEDTFIADLSVGLNIPYIKTGSMSRGERIAKYNRLIRIEERILKK